jgi:hypothetical protein
MAAYSLYLVFEEFKLKQGIKLFVYNEDISNFAGAFTSSNNNNFNVLSVAPLPGEALIIEIDIPEGSNDFGQLVLTQVGHDYRNEFGKNRIKVAMAGPSQDCNVDINCPVGAAWQNEKRAVCKLIANGELCTGTLINNAGSAILPYFLTAYHCIQTPSIAASAIFYFNYERPFCGATSEKTAQTLSGASLLATTDNKLDFTLLKLNKFPPVIYRPYFAGWDINPFSPSNGVCIHQPNGDVKKISLENHQLITANFGEGFDLNSHWLVRHWEVGSTQGGSSGSPIFNSSHRIFGTLSGGDATCSNPVNDYFTKLSRAWADYPAPGNQLEAWLDPNNTSVSFVEGIDPYGFTDAHCDTFSNVSPTDTLEINKSNFSWGWISGHNSAAYSRFAEKFYISDSLRLPGIFINVAKAYYANVFSNITIKIWEGSAQPTIEKYSKDVYIKDLQKNALNFIDFDSLLILSGSFFIGYTINYQIHADTFAVYHAENRGTSGISNMFIYNGSWHNIKEVTSPSIYTSLAISYPGCKGLNLSVKVPEITKRSLKIYPNPCYDYALIDFPYNPEHLTVECVDIIGKSILLKYEQVDQVIRIDLSNVHPGIYTLLLKAKSSQWTGRFVVLGH